MRRRRASGPAAPRYALLTTQRYISGTVPISRQAHPLNVRSRRLFSTTNTELNAIAAPAIIGLR